MPLRIDPLTNQLIAHGDKLVTGSASQIVTNCQAIVSGLSELTASKVGGGIRNVDTFYTPRREWTLDWSASTTGVASHNGTYPFQLKQIRYSSINPSLDYTVPSNTIIDILASGMTKAEKLSQIGRHYWLQPAVNVSYTIHHDCAYSMPVWWSTRSGSNNTCDGFSSDTQFDQGVIEPRSFPFLFDDFLPVKFPDGCSPNTVNIGEGNTADWSEPYWIIWDEDPPTVLPFYGVALANTPAYPWYNIVPAKTCLQGSSTHQYAASPADGVTSKIVSYNPSSIVDQDETYTLSQSYASSNVEQHLTLVPVASL